MKKTVISHSKDGQRRMVVEVSEGKSETFHEMKKGGTWFRKINGQEISQD